MKLRWMFGLVFVLALALALAACGGGDEEEEGNGGGGETPAATQTVEAGETEEPEETEEPSSGGGGGASLGDVPIYPGADKIGSYSGDFSYPGLVGDLGDEDYTNVEWGLFETDDSVDDVSDFYKDKMADKGWDEEGWFDFSFEAEAAWGGFTRDDGDSGAWVVITRNEDDDKTEIMIGVGSK